MLMRRSLAALALTLATSIVAAPAGAAELVVVVDGVRDAAGDIRVALFDGPETFGLRGKQAQRVVLPASPGTVQAVFADLPPGLYAVTIYHDADRNGELNRALGLLPTEGWGASNHDSRVSRPAWETSRFEVGAEGAGVRIRLNY